MASGQSLARLDEGGSPQADCAAVAECPELGLDAERCVDTSGWFEVTVLSDEPVGVRLVGEVSGLESGRWFTVVPSPAGCAAALVLTFEVP